VKVENDIDCMCSANGEEAEEFLTVSDLTEGKIDPFGMHVGSFVWNLDDNSLRCSVNAHALVGTESISTLDEALSLLHPDDRALFLRDTDKMISEKQLPPRELRVILSDGTLKTLLVAGEFSCDSKGKPIRCCGVVYDVTESKRADEAARNATELRNIITTLSTRLINLPFDDIDAGIQSSLETLGRFFTRVDRSYVFLVSDDGQKVSNTHEWCAEGVTPQRERLQDMSLERLPWLYKKIQNFEVVHIRDVSRLPRAAQAEKREFERQKIRSLIVVPMVLQHVLAGFVGFDSVREKETWTGDIISVLRLVGEIIANAMDRKKAEVRLKQSEEKYRALFDFSGDAILLLKGGRCFDCNEQAERLFGYNRERIIGAFPWEFSPPFQEDGSRSREKALEMISRALTDRPPVFEWLHQKPDGIPITTEVTLTAVHLGDETIVQAIVRDISDRKLAENELELSRQRLQSLASHLISVREEEKSHIARELHDELGQVLTALNMDLKWLGGKLRKSRVALSSKTDRMAELVTQTIRTVKRIQGELRPTLLDNLGLIAALEWQIKELQERTSLDVSFSHPDEIEADEDRAIALFRIFQEAQTNVVRHARASRIEIALSETDDELLLTVADNGKGLGPEDYNKPDSFGLLGIKERVFSLRGQFSIDSKDGTGTRLDIKIPKKPLTLTSGPKNQS